MNLWIKYGPLMYTFSSRLNWPVQIKNKWISQFSYKKKILNILRYIRELIMDWFFVILYLYIAWYLNASNFIFSFLLYIYLYIIFLVFYEIWYIYNDIFSVKKEKKPTYYVEHNKDIKFWKINILYRIILWCLLLFPVYFLNNNLFFEFVILLFIMWVTYTIHNLIRNYNINIFTRTILRVSKMMIFCIIFLNLWINDTILVQKVLEAYFIFNFLDFFGRFMLAYNKRLWWINSETIERYLIINKLFISIILWILLNNCLFFIISLRIFPSAINSFIILCKKYWLRSNR